MGNSLRQKFIPVIICCKPQKSYTFRLDELEKETDDIAKIVIPEDDSNDNSNKNSDKIINLKKKPIKKNLLEVSSLRNIENESHRENNNDSLISQNNKIFSPSIFNDSLEDLNINEDQEIYEYFFSKIYEEINKARCNILSYSKLIEKYSYEIRSEEKNKNYLLSNGKKIYFYCGKEEFLESARELEKLNEEFTKENSFLKKLEYVKEINFPLPNDHIENVFVSGYIEKNFEDLKIKFKGKYEIKKLLFFKCTKDPVISIVIQAVLDLQRKNSKVLLSDDIKYININFKLLNNGMIGVFIIFAK